MDPLKYSRPSPDPFPTWTHTESFPTSLFLIHSLLSFPKKTQECQRSRTHCLYPPSSSLRVRGSYGHSTDVPAAFSPQVTRTPQRSKEVARWHERVAQRWLSRPQSHCLDHQLQPQSLVFLFTENVAKGFLQLFERHLWCKVCDVH